MMRATVFFFLCVFLLMGGIACTARDQPSAIEIPDTIENPDTFEIPDTIDISVTESGIVPLPPSVPAPWHSAGMVKYTKITAPSGEAIHFVAQNQISDEQMIRAREVLRMYLTDVPGTVYGEAKAVVADAMAANEAVLMLLNGRDDGNAPQLPAQTLYQDEIAVEGHPWYMNNEYEDHRDATFEEILHLVHDNGIGVDGARGRPGALPAFQEEIRTAQQNASSNGFQIWPLGAQNDPDLMGWYNELEQENSLTQEYLAAVIDSYYGLWGAWEEGGGLGMWGFYISGTRDEIPAEDPMGWALTQGFFSPWLTYTARIDSSLTGTFSLTFDAAEPYTHKSRYLLNARLLGTHPSQLKGNDQDNTLQGNHGNNILDGGAGTDTAIFEGNRFSYDVQTANSGVTVRDAVPGRDGVDTLMDMEFIQFADQVVPISEVSSPGDNLGQPGSPR